MKNGVFLRFKQKNIKLIKQNGNIHMTQFKFFCYGHENVRSTHETTLEFTTEHLLTVKGDCILAVKSSCSLKDLPNYLKDKMKIDGQSITVILEIDGKKEIIIGTGSSKLSFSDEHAIIIRKSSYVCSRTLMINSDKSASEISRDIVKALTEPSNMLTVTIQVN